MLRNSVFFCWINAGQRQRGEGGSTCSTCVSRSLLQFDQKLLRLLKYSQYTLQFLKYIYFEILKFGIKYTIKIIR